jgi:hypothetical protein
MLCPPVDVGSMGFVYFGVVENAGQKREVASSFGFSRLLEAAAVHRHEFTSAVQR